MNAALQSMNASAAPWAPWLWRVCWQGAIVIAVAWLLTLLFHARSARLRSWIWRLAYLKLVVLLVWNSPINLPLLPAAGSSGQLSVVSGQAAGSRTQGTGDKGQEEIAVDKTQAIPADAKTTQADDLSSVDRDKLQADDNPSTVVAVPSAIASVPQESPHTAIETAPPAARLTFFSYLLLAWLLGMVLVCGWLAWETWLALRLRRGARMVSSPQLEALLDQIRQQLRLRCTVQIGESEAAPGPMLVKFFTPCIVFPSGMLEGVSEPSPRGRGQGEGASSPARSSPADSPSPLMGEGRGEGDERTVAALSPDEIRLVLAHELAHVKRRDLAWNALGAIVHVLLFFHPLVWLASRRSRQEQELACDEFVITRLGVPGYDYGQLLLKIVRHIGHNFPRGMAVIGMASSYQTLSRRIEAMKRIRSFSRRQVVAAGLLIAMVGVVAVVPWRLVAQEAKESGQKDRAQGAGGGAQETAAGSGQGSGVSDKAATDGRAAEPTDDKSSAAAVPSDQAALKKLLVGTWQGGHYYDELTLHEDGTFDRFSRYWYLVPRRSRPIQEGATTVPVEPTHEAAYEDRFERGTWQLGQQENPNDKGATKNVATLTLDSKIDEHNVPLWRTTTVAVPLASLPATPAPSPALMQERLQRGFPTERLE